MKHMKRGCSTFGQPRFYSILGIFYYFISDVRFLQCWPDFLGIFYFKLFYAGSEWHLKSPEELPLHQQ